MNSLLIIVDFQNDFISGTLGFPAAAELVIPLKNRVEKAIADGWDLAFTLDTHEENYLETREGRELPIVHCVKGSDGWRVNEEIQPFLARAVRVFEKGTFPSLELANFLSNSGYKRLELVGLVSNICVISNAVMARAALPEAEISVNSALTCCADKDLNDKAIEVMKNMQVNII